MNLAEICALQVLLVTGILPLFTVERMMPLLKGKDGTTTSPAQQHGQKQDNQKDSSEGKKKKVLGF